MSEHRGIGTRTVRGVAWAYSGYVGGRALVLISTAILARLLTPHEFGVVALALVFMTFLDAVKDFGLGQALIGATTDEEAERSQTVFGWTIVIGLTLSLFVAAVSPLVAHFFHEDELRALLPVVGSMFFIRAIGATHYALARKNLHYRVRTAADIAEVSVRGALSIALALAGAGVWSLVIGFVAGAVTSTIVLWLIVDFRPKLRLSRTHLRDLLRFGGVLTVVDISAVLFYNLDYIFIGRILGASALGLYTIGFRIPELVILNVGNVAANVLFPAYAALDPARLRDGYLMAMRYTTMLTVPIASGLVVLASPLVLVVFGDDWTGSIDVARVIAVYALIVTLSIPAGTILKVSRRARLMIAFSVPSLLVLVVLLLIFAHHGIVAVAIATTALEAAMFPLQNLAVSRILDVKLRQTLRVVIAPFGASAVMVAVIWPLSTSISRPLPALLAGIGVGAVIYLGALWILARDTLLALRSMAFPKQATSG